MARTYVLTDDIDGSSGAETIEFAYGGVNYAIDLGKKNRSALDKALKPYVSGARKVTRRPRAKAVTRGRKPHAMSSTDLSAIRAWASTQGIAVADRGRIAKDVVEAYRAAN